MERGSGRGRAPKETTGSCITGNRGNRVTTLETPPRRGYSTTQRSGVDPPPLRGDWLLPDQSLQGSKGGLDREDAPPVPRDAPSATTPASCQASRSAPGGLGSPSCTPLPPLPSLPLSALDVTFSLELQSKTKVKKGKTVCHTRVPLTVPLASACKGRRRGRRLWRVHRMTGPTEMHRKPSNLETSLEI